MRWDHSLPGAGEISPARLARLVRDTRRAAGLTQLQLATAAGVSVGVVRDLEQGRTRQPRRRSVERIAAALGAELDLSDLAPGPRDGPEAGTADVPGLAGAAGGGDRLTAGVRLRVLGPLTAWRDGTAVALGPARQRAVLGLLAVQPNSLVRRDAICEALWAGDPPATAVSKIQSYVSRLRHLLDPARSPGGGDGLLVTARSGYRLQVTGEELDLIAFGELHTRARAAQRAGQPAAACALYEQALGLWRDEPLADVGALRGHPAVDALARQRAAAVEEYAELAAARARVLRQHVPGSAALPPPAGQHDDEAPAGQHDDEAPAGQHDDEAPAGQHDDEAPGEQPTTRAAPGTPAAPATQIVPRQLPAAASHFVGRAGELTALSRLLDQVRDDAGAVMISVIGGTAGVGKTTLAVQWAHQVAGWFPDGQLYVNLRGFGPAASPVSPAEALRGFLDALAIPPAQLPASLESLAGLYRSLLSGRRVLVVLDNARDAAQVRPLLPGGGRCAVVITSRSQLTGLVASDGAQPLTLDVLTDADARELLARRMSAERLAREPDAAAELAGLCARLPLALAITAARAAAHPGVRLRVLAAELDDAMARLDALEAGQPATSIRAVFSWSYENLPAEASRMFRLLALHPGPDIAVPAAASLAGTGLRPAGRLLHTLARAGLLTEHVSGRFAFHDLLRAYAAELVRSTESDSERRAAAYRGLDHYLHTAHTAAALSQLNREPLALKPPRPGSVPEQLVGEDAALAWFQAENQILRAAIAQAVADGFDTHAWQLTCTLAPFVHRSGHWHQHEWSIVLATALAAAQRQGDIAGQARVHWELGFIRIRLGRHDDALSHLSRALDMYRQLGDKAGQANSHLGLALLFDQQKHEAEAVRHAERALDLYRAARYRAGQASALNAAGWYSTKLGQHQQALAYCQQALDLHRELGSRPGEAGTLDSIGYAHHHLGHYAQAIACYQSALGMLRKLADYDAEAIVLSHLGDAQYATGHPLQARDSWRQALAILDDSHDPEADEVRAKLRSLAIAEARDRHASASRPRARGRRGPARSPSAGG